MTKDGWETDYLNQDVYHYPIADDHSGIVQSLPTDKISPYRVIAPSVNAEYIFRGKFTKNVPNNFIKYQLIS
jgi:hypothetical protein